VIYYGQTRVIAKSPGFDSDWMILLIVKASAKIRGVGGRQGKNIDLYNKKQDVLSFTLHDRNEEFLPIYFVALGFSAY
jgi:hypothetical protein